MRKQTERKKSEAEKWGNFFLILVSGTLGAWWFLGLDPLLSGIAIFAILTVAGDTIG